MSHKPPTYSPHHFGHAEGSIYLGNQKAGAVTITLTGAASMSQAELDEYGRLFASVLCQKGRTMVDQSERDRRKIAKVIRNFD